jgi:hypothetical protein
VLKGPLICLEPEVELELAVVRLVLNLLLGVEDH